MLPGHQTVETRPEIWSLRPRVPWPVHCGCWWSKRHIQPPQHTAIPTLPPRISGVSPKGNLLSSSQGGKLCNMARPDYHTHPQALPRLEQNAEGTHERAVERSAANKDYSTSNNQSRTRNSKFTSTNHQKALRHLHCGVQTVGHHPHRPYQRIPNHITMRLLVHNGGHPSGCKLYLLQINEKPNWRQDDLGLPKNGQQDEALGTWVKTSPFGQRVLGKIQRMHCKERDDPQASSLKMPPLQHYQRGYPDIQKPFCLHPQQSWR